MSNVCSRLRYVEEIIKFCKMGLFFFFCIQLQSLEWSKTIPLCCLSVFLARANRFSWFPKQTFKFSLAETNLYHYGVKKVIAAGWQTRHDSHVQSRSPAPWFPPIHVVWPGLKWQQNCNRCSFSAHVCDGMSRSIQMKRAEKKQTVRINSIRHLSGRAV